MTIDREMVLAMAVQARRVDRLVSRLASWIAYPPADASQIGDLEQQARIELRGLCRLVKHEDQP